MTGTSTVRVIGARNEDGFTLIDMLFVVALIGLLSTLAIPGLMRAKDAAQSASALGTLRLVNSSQLSYAISCGLGFYAPDFLTLTVKPVNSAEAFLAPEVASGNTFFKSGYTFSMAGTAHPGAPPTCNGLAAGTTSPGYAIVADQVNAGSAGGRFFGTNADGIIYENGLSLAATMPESGGPPEGAPIR
jgi:type II secretory pathway pseudopilin PulG